VTAVHQPATLNWAIGDYVLESVIRAGGRATVYTARRRGVADLRALKVITIGTGGDAQTIADAERRGAELQQVFAQRHGLVPWVEEIGETRNYLYVAMELVPGQDLFDILALGPLSPPHALEVAIELATFLEQTHGFEAPGRGPERIIHADLKPGNVRVRPDGHIRVLDFGIAKAMAERRIVTTQKWGTRQYMSPEWLETGTIDEQVDYWSLGVLFYEMLAGYRPFRRFERQDNLLEDAIRRRERPEALPRSVDLAIQQVLWRLLAPHIRQRFANAAEIRAALEACRRGAPALLSGLAIRDDIPTEPVHAVVPDIVTEKVPAAAPAVVQEDSPATEPVPVPAALRAAADADAHPIPVQRDSLQQDSPPTEPVPAPAVGSTIPLPSSLPLASSSMPPPLPPLDAAVPASPRADTAAARRPPTRRETLRKYVVSGFWMIFAVILASEGMACIAAERLRCDAAVADEQHLDEALQRRERLAGWTLFDAGLHLRADPVLKGRLVSLADGVITNYRQEQPTVVRADWERARTWLHQAVGLYPGDDKLLAKMRYTEGHLQRLLGMQRTELNQPKNARQNYYAAIQKFQEAASLDPKSPDPYLGLTQTYIYGLGDIDAALDAQKAAEKRGYRLNRRERASLGDGYRARGERTWRSARDLKDDQQREAYERAQEDFKRCVESFGPIVEFANAADQLHRCEARLTEFENRKTPWWKRLFGSSEFELHLTGPARPESPRPESQGPESPRPELPRSESPRPESPR
jgi:serine/threonine-protein kinase